MEYLKMWFATWDGTAGPLLQDVLPRDVVIANGGHCEACTDYCRLGITWFHDGNFAEMYDRVYYTTSTSSFDWLVDPENTVFADVITEIKPQGAGGMLWVCLPCTTRAKEKRLETERQAEIARQLRAKKRSMMALLAGTA